VEVTQSPKKSPMKNSSLEELRANEKNLKKTVANDEYVEPLPKFDENAGKISNL
jgi:hypothetical protein